MLGLGLSQEKRRMPPSPEETPQGLLRIPQDTAAAISPPLVLREPVAQAWAVII